MSIVTDFKAINSRLRGDDWWEPEVVALVPVSDAELILETNDHALAMAEITVLPPELRFVVDKFGRMWRLPMMQAGPARAKAGPPDLSEAT